MAKGDLKASDDVLNGGTAPHAPEGSDAVQDRQVQDVQRETRDNVQALGILRAIHRPDLMGGLNEALGEKEIPITDAYFQNSEYVLRDLYAFANTPRHCPPDKLRVMTPPYGILNSNIMTRAGVAYEGGEYLERAAKALGIFDSAMDEKKKKKTSATKDNVDRQWKNETLRRLKIIAGLDPKYFNDEHNPDGKNPFFDEAFGNSPNDKAADDSGEPKPVMDRTEAQNADDVKNGQQSPKNPADAVAADAAKPPIAESAPEESQEPRPEPSQEKDRGLVPVAVQQQKQDAETGGGTESFRFGAEYYTDQQLIRLALAYFSRVLNVAPDDLTARRISDVSIPLAAGKTTTGGQYLDHGIPHFADVAALVRSVEENDYRDPDDESAYFTAETLRDHARHLVLERLIDAAFAQEQSDAPAASGIVPASRPTEANQKTNSSTADVSSIQQVPQFGPTIFALPDLREEKEVKGKEEKIVEEKKDDKKTAKAAPAPKGVWSVGRPSVKGSDHLEDLLRKFPEGTAGRKRILSLMRLRGYDPLAPAPVAETIKDEPKKEEKEKNKVDARESEESKKEAKKAA